MNRFNDTKKAYWFDTVIDELDSKITISENSVITSIDNYDYGLPGSGILIWHIKKIDGEKQFMKNLE